MHKTELNLLAASSCNLNAMSSRTVLARGAAGPILWSVRGGVAGGDWLTYAAGPAPAACAPAAAPQDLGCAPGARLRCRGPRLQWQTVLRHAMKCDAVLCNAVPGRALPCFSVPCHAVQRCTLR